MCSLLAFSYFRQVLHQEQGLMYKTVRRVRCAVQFPHLFSPYLIHQRSFTVSHYLNPGWIQACYSGLSKVTAFMHINLFFEHCFLSSILILNNLIMSIKIQSKNIFSFCFTCPSRIERLWRDVFIQVLDPFHVLFRNLEREGMLNPDDESHLFALHWAFLP